MDERQARRLAYNIARGLSCLPAKDLSRWDEDPDVVETIAERIMNFDPELNPDPPFEKGESML